MAREVAMEGLRRTEQGRKRKADETFDEALSPSAQSPGAPSDSDDVVASALDDEHSADETEVGTSTSAASHKRRKAALATGNMAYNAASGPIKDVFGEVSSIVNRAEAEANEIPNRIAMESNEIRKAHLEVNKGILGALESINGMLSVLSAKTNAHVPVHRELGEASRDVSRRDGQGEFRTKCMMNRTAQALVSNIINILCIYTYLLLEIFLESRRGKFIVVTDLRAMKTGMSICKYARNQEMPSDGREVETELIS